MANFGDISTNLTIGASQTIWRNASNSSFEALSTVDMASYVPTFEYLDASYVRKTGDTMTGDLTINSSLFVNGNVGIGNITDLQATLDVSGNFHTSGAAKFDTSIYVLGNAYLGDVSTDVHTILGDVNITGNLTATTKSFLIEHPIKPGKKLQYGNLEGPEFGVYYRGKYTTNQIMLPDYWEKLIDENSITVNLTSTTKWNVPYVKNVFPDHVDIGKVGFGKLQGYYIVYAERKDIGKLSIEE